MFRSKTTTQHQKKKSKKNKWAVKRKVIRYALKEKRGEQAQGWS